MCDDTLHLIHSLYRPYFSIVQCSAVFVYLRFFLFRHLLLTCPLDLHCVTQVGVMFLDDKEKQSGETQGKVDDEVRLLLSDSYSRAKKLLETHRKELDLIAQVIF